MKHIDIDEKIKHKFKLFQGLRSQEDDQKIYDKIYDLCFDEMVGFLFENLSPAKRDEFSKDIENTGKKTEILLKYLSQIENYRFKLDKRLDYFLNNLLYSSLKNKK